MKIRTTIIYRTEVNITIRLCLIAVDFFNFLDSILATFSLQKVVGKSIQQTYNAYFLLNAHNKTKFIAKYTMKIFNKNDNVSAEDNNSTKSNRK